MLRVNIYVVACPFLFAELMTIPDLIIKQKILNILSSLTLGFTPIHFKSPTVKKI